MKVPWVWLGVAAALGSNLAWIIGSMVFSKVLKGAISAGINLGRGLLTLVYLGLALALAGVQSMTPEAAGWLALSGLLGMAAGDTLFFEALLRLGPRQTLLLGMSGPLFTIVLGVALLHEQVSTYGWLGFALTLLGVFSVLPVEQPAIQPKNRRVGTTCAVMAAFCMAGSNILAKKGLASVLPLQATFVRVLFSVMALTLTGWWRGQLGLWLAPFGDRRTFLQIQAAVLVVVFGGFFLSMLALSCIDVSTAAALISVEPLMALVTTALVMGHPIRTREWMGVSLGAVGVGLVMRQVAG